MLNDDSAPESVCAWQRGNGLLQRVRIALCLHQSQALVDRGIGVSQLQQHSCQALGALCFQKGAQTGIFYFGGRRLGGVWVRVLARGDGDRHDVLAERAALGSRTIAGPFVVRVMLGSRIL